MQLLERGTRKARLIQVPGFQNAVRSNSPNADQALIERTGKKGGLLGGLVRGPARLQGAAAAALNPGGACQAAGAACVPQVLTDPCLPSGQPPSPAAQASLLQASSEHISKSLVFELAVQNVRSDQSMLCALLRVDNRPPQTSLEELEGNPYAQKPQPLCPLIALALDV